MVKGHKPSGLGQLTALMERTSGQPEIVVGLLDGEHSKIDAIGQHLFLKYNDT